MTFAGRSLEKNHILAPFLFEPPASSFRMSESFLRSGSLVFFWNLACMTEPDFLEKIPIGQKWPKWSKNKVFGLFKKIMSLVLSGICVKWKFLRFINILRKLRNEISVFFNRQYFTNRLISDFNFWHVDRHEWKKQGSSTGFLKKFSFWEMSHFGPKNCTSS